MSCERTLPLLPLVALDTADAADRTAALDHVAGCGRCAAALRDLEAARAALSSFTVEETPATEAAAIRVEPATARAGAGRAAGRPRIARFGKVAALLVVSLALGFAWLHGELTLERGAATLRIAWRSPAPAEDRLAAPAEVAGGATPEALAAAIDELARQLNALDARHQRDLLLLAETVDRQQRTRDRGVERRMHSLEQQTRDGFVFTNQVLDHVVDRLVQSDGKPEPAVPNDH